MNPAIQKYFETVSKELNNNIDHVDMESLKKAASLILDSEAASGRVHVCGIGKPSYVAGYIASLLSSTGTSAYVLDGTEAVHGSSGQVKKNDVVIAISNSGETAELKATVGALTSNGAAIIACTGDASSWLATHAEVCLLAHVEQEGDTLNKPPRASILSEIMILQSLSILLQEAKKLSYDEYLKWHPGGSLGNSIRAMKEKEEHK